MIRVGFVKKEQPRARSGMGIKDCKSERSRSSAEKINKVCSVLTSRFAQLGWQGLLECPEGQDMVGS